MTDTIIDGTNIDTSVFSFSDPKPNPAGGKVVNLYNKNFKQSLTISTPLMLTWGAQEGQDPTTKLPNGKWTMSLQFPSSDFTNQEGILYACILSLVFLFCFKNNLIKKTILLCFLLFFIFLYFYLNIIFKNSGFFHEPVLNNFERLKDFNLFIDSFIYISLHLIKS